MNILALMLGQIASKVDILDEPRWRCRFNTNDGSSRVQVGDEHCSEAKRGTNVNEKFIIANKFGGHC